jgi:hypothetical protein
MTPEEGYQLMRRVAGKKFGDMDYSDIFGEIF